MPVFRHTSRPRRLLWLFAALPLLSACGGGADIGEPCDRLADCADSLQCLGHTCVPRCTRHTDCGDGHQCQPDGVCVLVDTAVGETCEREVDCGPGQSCLVLCGECEGCECVPVCAPSP